MSYVLRPPVDTAGFVENPLTADLDAASNNITAIGVADALSVVAGDNLEMTNPAGTVGLYGVAPAPQHPPIADAVGANPHANEIAINDILNALRALGVVSV